MNLRLPATQQRDHLLVLLQNLLILLDQNLVLGGLQNLKTKAGFGDGLCCLFGRLGLIAKREKVCQQLTNRQTRERRVGDRLAVGQ